jgi:hypothetical protein
MAKKPAGAMGSPNWMGDASSFAVPKKYSHLPASEARALIAKEEAEAEAKRIEAEVNKRVQAQLKVELAKVKPSGAAAPNKKLDPRDLVKLAEIKVLKDLNVDRFDADGVLFTVENVQYKIIKA